MKVWEITPHPTDNTYTSYVEKNHREMLKFVGGNIDIFLEQFDEDELTKGVSLTFKLIKMSEETYQEIVEITNDQSCS